MVHAMPHRNAIPKPVNNLVKQKDMGAFTHLILGHEVVFTSCKQTHTSQISHMVYKQKV